MITYVKQTRDVAYTLALRLEPLALPLVYLLITF